MECLRRHHESFFAMNISDSGARLIFSNLSTDSVPHIARWAVHGHMQHRGVRKLCLLSYWLLTWVGHLCNSSAPCYVMPRHMHLVRGLRISDEWQKEPQRLCMVWCRSMTRFWLIREWQRSNLHSGGRDLSMSVVQIEPDPIPVVFR